MRIRLDPWPVDIQGGQLTLKTFGGTLDDVETPRWAAIPARPIPERLKQVFVVDGKRRMESRIFIEDPHGQSGLGGFGAYVVGAVELCPHGTRQAELLAVKAQRLLAHAPNLLVEPAQLTPRNPHTGQLEYAPAPMEGHDPLAALNTLQQHMLSAEQRLSHELASRVPLDETDDREWLTALTIQDGTLRGQNLNGAVVGCVKTMETMYLPTDRAGLLSDLKPGERTPILRMTYEGGQFTRLIWYVRLSEAAFYQHPMSGVMRLEMFAPDDTDFLPPIVRQVANLSGTLLTRLGSRAHKDPRAPQNLIPTAALEQAMNRSMGSADLVTRRIRAHIAATFGQGGRGMTGVQGPSAATGAVVGMVLGTQDVTPVSFWFAVQPGASIQLDDLVVVGTRKPDGAEVRFYGIVDHVRTRHEGVTFDSDVQDVAAGLLPASVSYAARVLVTRVHPENFIPPQPGDVVRHARDADLRMALSADKMGDRAFPGGLLADGQVLPLNYRFVNGENGGHINISGISGVATKTSYALFLLHSIFRSGVMGASASAGRALIFNVKGEDLLFLDQANRDVTAREADAQAQKGLPRTRYDLMRLPAEPFRDVQFLAPPRPGSAAGAIVPHVEQRATGVTPFLYSLREFCLRRMLPYVFVDRDASVNLGFVIGSIEDRLYRLAQGADTPYLTVEDWQPDTEQLIDEDVRFDELGGVRISTFPQLVAYLEYKLLDANDGEGDRKWVGKQSPATLQAFIRRLRGVQKHLTPLVRGDLSAAQAAQYRPDPLKPGVQTTVVDIHTLSATAQMFVVGVLLRDLFEHKERVGRQDTVFVVLDELNKYAPRDGDSPIKDVLLDIAERGRSLGIILIGAQQTASEVERRIVSNAAIRVVGRLDLAEAERPEYRFLPQSFRARAGILQPGTMLVSQPDVPNPVLVNYPFPAWATRKDEVDDLRGKKVEDVGDDWLR